MENLFEIGKTDQIGHDRNVDASITANVFGYLQKMETFSFYFNLKFLIFIFQRIENLNGAFQNINLTLGEIYIRF